MKSIGIFGTSGMARETGDVAWALGFRPIYVARTAADASAWTEQSDVMLESDISSSSKMPFAIGIGDNGARQLVAQRYGQQLDFLTLIHPSASFGIRQREAVQARRGVIVLAGVRFTNGIRIGDFCIFNQNALIAHDVVVDDFTHIAPGAIVSGNVHLGKACWIGAGAVVNQGTAEHKLTVGTGTVIGSGAVVLQDCQPGAVYVGVPARRVK